MLGEAWLKLSSQLSKLQPLRLQLRSPVSLGIAVLPLSAKRASPFARPEPARTARYFSSRQVAEADLGPFQSPFRMLRAHVCSEL